MKYYHREILDFYMRDFKESLILQCFTDKENYLLFPYYGLDEITAFIKDNQQTYKCLVMTKENEKMKIRFKLETYEHYEYNETETRALIIEETEDEDYIRNIAPKIRKVIQKHNVGMNIH